MEGKLTWRKWIEPWYVAYVLLGATAAGLAPILLPLAVSRTESAAQVGLVMAAFSLGGLAAPLAGDLADRYRLHRWLLAGGLLVTAFGLAAFPFTTSLAAWFGLALLQGAGAAAAATVANLFVVEAHPQAEWDERIGWLQTAYGGGQVAGLLLAGALSQSAASDVRTGLLVAAGLTALAVLPGWFTAHTPPRAQRPPAPQPTLPHQAHRMVGSERERGKSAKVEWPAGQRIHGVSTGPSTGRLGVALRSHFGLFLVAWLLSFVGAAAVFSLYPVLMQRVYRVAPGLSSPGFAVAAGLGLALYAPAGRWANRFGPRRVLQAGLGVRLLAFLSLLGLGLARSGSPAPGFSPVGLALLSFVFVVLAWSLLSVSGTALAAQLAPLSEGEGMGIFNAVTALAGVIGAALGGWAAGRWGYEAAPGLAALGVALGLILTMWPA